MQPTPTRRSVLAAVVSLSLTAGCAATSESRSTTARSSRTTPSPPPSRGLPVLAGESVGFHGDVAFPEAGVYGWVIDGSFTKSLDLTAALREGAPATVYVTDEQIREPRVPESTRVELEVPGKVESVTLSGGTGSILVRTTGEATVYLEFETDTI